MLGIRTFYKVAANLVITSSAALISTGLLSPIAAGETQSITYWVPFSVGATGGIRLQLVVPAGGTAFIASIKTFNQVVPSLTTVIQTGSAVLTNALANAGTHLLEITVTVVNGATAGNVDLQVAQNTSDPLSLTVLAGGFSSVIIS